MKHDPEELLARTYTLKVKNIRNIEQAAKITHRNNKSEWLDDWLTAHFANEEAKSEPDSAI